MRNFTTLIVLSVFTYSCAKTEDFLELSFTEKYPFNVIGISGKRSDTGYVEIIHTEAKTNGQNIISQRFVSPPMIIEGLQSFVKIDSIGTKQVRICREDRILGGRRQVAVDYSEGGSHYLKIINHGDNPIEYFIAGNHKARSIDVSTKENPQINLAQDVIQEVDILPRIMYKNAPIYYLIHPDEKPHENMYYFDFSYFDGRVRKICVNCKVEKTIYFSGNKVGDLVVDSPWNVSAIMELYRNEYNSNMTTEPLYFDIRTKEKFKKRLREGHSKYYGTIQPGDSIQSNDSNPFMTHVCGETYCDTEPYGIPEEF